MLTPKCNKNLAIANRSRVSCAHNTLRALIGLTVTPWPWNLSSGSLKVTGNGTTGQIIHDLLLVFDVKYYRDLEMYVRGHSRSLKVVPFESLGTVSWGPTAVSKEFWKEKKNSHYVVFRSVQKMKKTRRILVKKRLLLLLLTQWDIFIDIDICFVGYHCINVLTSKNRARKIDHVGLVTG